MAVPPPPNGNMMGWVNLGLRFLSILIIPVLVWVLSINNRVIAIESNRFTSTDAQEVYQAIGELEATKADQENVPAPEVLRRLSAIEAELVRLRSAILGARQ